MKRNLKYTLVLAVSVLLLTALALEQTTLAQAPAGPADPRLGSKVKYTSEQASVQDIVQSLAEQAGLKYDWKKSFTQTDQVCTQWVRNVAIEDKTCAQALEQILKPFGLGYQVKEGVLVLSRQAKSVPPSKGYVTDGPAPTGLEPAQTLSAKEQRENFDFLGIHQSPHTL